MESTGKRSTFDNAGRRARGEYVDVFEHSSAHISAHRSMKKDGLCCSLVRPR
ncbi:hypothetical protein BAUCODRAFT_125626 [Baudoinia panamericana UAMH 10762]|uniref:Uncharacterized protein n=1 Tax=Baudoinia panamericana (strain UAMH 10762) TaxID=717646 RepID=M2MML3_BAUPA|nr:uncharacterized protein BAUCODRAFT_125626 [Baudoinia panamericana UAMH 10762]EMC92648.1 hypothetical protein BAUCODRAFT_125626 [Baudoinia panamericana UAMH 10762]